MLFKMNSPSYNTSCMWPSCTFSMEMMYIFYSEKNISGKFVEKQVEVQQLDLFYTPNSVAASCSCWESNSCVMAGK